MFTAESVGGCIVQDFFAFREMWTLKIIKIVFILGLVGLGLAAVGSLIAVYSQGPSALLGLIGAVVGVFFWRLICEAMIIVFKMHESLEQMVKLAEREGATV